MVLSIVVLQGVYLFVNFSLDKIIDTNSIELIAFQNTIDSLKKVELEKRKPKVYPFNPNYITDYKGYKLGMSVEEIDRLHEYRRQNKFVNSKEEFQKITKVSDSLLNMVAPYFKFPDWVVKRNKQKRAKKLLQAKENKLKEDSKSIKKVLNTTNINKATQVDFETISGVGEVIAERIIKYRKKIKGFTYKEQLNEVWGLKNETVKSILLVFKIDNKPIIEKINVNTATFKEVLKNPYIDYNLCKKIFEYRDEVAELQNILELKNIDGFPIDKYERIVLYLEAK